MDKLLKYIDLAEISDKDFAEQIGISQVLFSMCKRGKSKIQPAIARKIEQVTHGIVTKEDIRPDIFY